MKLVRAITAFLACCTVLACSSDNSDDLLKNTALLGEWEIVSHSGDPSLNCCEFLEFSLDDKLDDFVGTLISHGPEYNNSGTFELFQDDQTVLLYHNGEYELYDFIVENQSLTLLKQETIKVFNKVQ